MIFVKIIIIGDNSMNNEVYFKQIKPFYNSLKYFDVKNNYLILHTTQDFILPLIKTNLELINKDIFLAQPNEIFHFFQMHELLYKQELTEKEIAYISDFTNKYLQLKNNNNEGKDINNITLWCIELLISIAFRDEFINNPASQKIISLIDNFNKELESGLNTSVKLVLTKNGNQNFLIEEEIDNIKNFEKAGFTTLFIVIITVVLTCLFLAFFIMKH